MYPLNLTIVTISNYRAHPPEGSDSSNHYAQVFYQRPGSLKVLHIMLGTLGLHSSGQRCSYIY